MNKIHRFATASVVCAGLMVPGATLITPAFAEPYPWHEPHGAVQSDALVKPKTQIEHEELLKMGKRSSPADQDSNAVSTDDTAFPWESIGLIALGAGVLTAGSAAVARRHQRVGTTA